MAPDYEVIDRPELVKQGIDPSLDKAIELLLNELEANLVPDLVIPTPPVETGAPGEAPVRRSDS